MEAPHVILMTRLLSHRLLPKMTWEKMSQGYRTSLCHKPNISFGNSVSNMSSVYQRSEFTVTEVFAVTCILAKSPPTLLAKQNASHKVINKVATYGWAELIFTQHLRLMWKC